MNFHVESLWFSESDAHGSTVTGTGHGWTWERRRVEADRLEMWNAVLSV